MMDKGLGKQSIRRKLFLGMLLTTLTALLIFGGALVANDLRDYRERLIADLSTQSRLIGLSAIPALQFDDRQLAADSLALLEARPNVLAAAIYNASGELFAAYRRANADARAIPRQPEFDSRRVEGTSLLLSRHIVSNGEMLGTIYLEGSYRLYERLWQYLSIVAAVMVVALVISMLLSLWLQKRVTRPILGITSLARQVIERRDYELRAEKLTNDEVGYLADAFNDLLSEVGARSKALQSSNDEVLTLNAQLEQRVAERTAELERANNELEAFSYSVSHDLRTPLRAIDGFSQALLEDYVDQLDEIGRDYLTRVRAGAQRMGRLIDDLLKLARVSRAGINEDVVDLSGIAEEIARDLRERDPERDVSITISSGLSAVGDTHLLRIVLENLLNNAWKYTGKRSHAAIEFGVRNCAGEACFFVEDNGAGFDMAYAGKLFGAFQRLHDAREYAGTGVGLATVQRIIHRHGGKIWAEAAIDKGAVFYFTLLTKDSANEYQAYSAGGRQLGR